MLKLQHNKQQKMRLKLKQSKNNIKYSLLPPIIHFHPNRYSSRQNNTNRSLPKISSNMADSTTQHINICQNKVTSVNKHPIKDRLKAMCQKLNKNEPKIYQQRFFSDNEVDDANIMSNFQRQIDKNLKLIKQEKQNQRKKIITSKQQCISQRSSDISYNLVANINKQSKSLTEEDVFTKINQIILKSQSKSKKKEMKGDPSYSSSIMVNKFNDEEDYHRKQENRVLKTEGYESQKAQKNTYSNKAKPKIQFDFKHDGNYNEWRKLSINSENKEKVTYEMSSYDLETDRLQKIRSKNDLSLKKYFEGKSYLKKLIKCRQSNVLLAKKI